MNQSDSSAWDEDIELDPVTVYQSLVRSLRWANEFGIYFVCCAPSEGQCLVPRLQEAVTEKRMAVLSLTEPIDNLYEQVKALPNHEQLNVLFVEGVEHSLYDYEQHRSWEDDAERYHYSQSGVPRLLSHLNLSRERFQDFNLCFVFLLPRFALKYLIHRAPDFFDWHSGVFDLALEKPGLSSRSPKIWLERGCGEYEQLSPEDICHKIREIRSLLEETDLAESQRFNLEFELGALFAANRNYEAAIAAFDSALKIKPDDYYTFQHKGYALERLGRYEDAIAAFDSALKIKPDHPSPYYNKACAYALQSQINLALESLQQAIQLEPAKYSEMAQTDSDFDAIRADKRFQALLNSD